MKKVLWLIFFISISINLSGSTYWQNHVEYDIEVKLDDQEHMLYGEQEIKYFNNSPDTLKKIYLLLYPNAYKDTNTAFAKQQLRLGKTKFKKSSVEERGYIDIANIAVENEHVMLTIPLDSLTIAYFEPPQPVLPGDSINISLTWKVKIPVSFSRFCHEGQNYYVTQWFPKIPVYDNDGWHSYPYLEIGGFYYEFGDYDVSITLPDNYVVGATGVLNYPKREYELYDSLSTLGKKVLQMSEEDFKEWSKANYTPESSDRQKTVNFTARNVVDFAWVASKDYLVQQDNFVYRDSRDSILIQNLFFAKNRNSWRDAIHIMKKTLQSYGDLCGPYPYSKVLAVDGDLSAGGGMEYPMLTIVNARESQYLMWQVIGHEVGHNWFYGALGFNERKYAWMDEGLNTYGEVRFMEDYLPDSTSLLNSLPLSSFFNRLIDNYSNNNMVHISLNTLRYNRMLQPSNLRGNEYESMLSYAASVYYKPGFGFKLLEKYVGREKFDMAMNDFFNEWKFRHPYPADLQKSLEESLEMDLDWLFQDYLDSIRFPDYRISSYTVKKEDSGYSTQLSITNNDSTEQPLQIALYRDKSEIKSAWLHPQKGVRKITINTATKPDEIRINPQLSTLESKYLNNYSRKIPPLDFNFLFDFPQPNKYLINYVPYMNFNYYDGLKLGGGLYHLSSMMPKNTYLAYGSYAFKSKELNGTFLYTTRIYGDQLSYKLSSGLSHDVLKNKIDGRISVNLLDKKRRNNVLSLQLSYLDVKDTELLDTPYWTAGKFYHTTLENKFSYEDKEVKINSKAGLKYIYNSAASAGYWKIFGEIEPVQKVSNFLKIENRFYLGAYLASYDLPKQYRHYASGTLDPEFHQIYLYDRSGDTRLSPFYNYFIPGGVNLKGYQNMTDEYGDLGGSSIALGYNLKLRMGTGFLFFDAGDVVSDAANYEINYDLGFGLDTGILSFYFPIYVSNPYDQYDEVSGWDALKKRFLIHLDLTRLNSFFGR